MNKLSAYAPFNAEMAKIARAMGNEAKTAYIAVVDAPTSDGTASTLKTNARKSYGIVDRVGANFARHGIFIEKGAARGHGGLVGSKWKDKHGVVKTTNPNSLGKMNTGIRPAKVWLEPILDRYTTEIADRANFHFANIARELALDAFPVNVKRNKA